MATIEESAVFEYCEEMFRKFQERDGGYYPSKHDKPAFVQTAEHFSISIDEVNRIFHEYSKLAADVEMEKINKLPPPLRKRFMEQRAKDLFCNNRDLPYYKIEGSPSSDLTEALDVLSEEYRSLVEYIAQVGWTIPLNIDIQRFQKIKQLIGNDVELEQYFINYYSGGEFRLMCRKIEKTIENDAQRVLFNECVDAFENGKFSICITTLLTVLEGQISFFGDDPTDVRMMRICCFRATDEMNKKHNIKSLCWLSMNKFIKNLYQKSDFSQPEPCMINRHWIQHGRTGRLVEKADCIRVFNALSTIASIKQFQPKQNY
ncbi:hypothetical protein CLNEO_09950 [Anaerotignum neopropionicum]|uniref:Uncharacterized protein n=1 Tax=Anaerotignum neopropionicum TaxID=36847 RepID=A0A136WHE6_9FIRM|nr:hypothetical protein [Anaerotignum neopropionicum]KXL53769.1 hypothetical protein CLNEO_09950 [Anaerotignum neopropionicum]